MCEDTEMEPDDSKAMDTVGIRAEPIELFKVLKLDGVVSGGGEAKLLIADGQVRVNGEVETRKRKKISHGDVVAYLNRKIRVEVSHAENEPSA
jgi:ribosome-associated protein